MDFKDFYAGINDQDRRLDKVLRIFASQLQLSAIYKYLRKGLIRVNDKKSQPDYRVNSGDKISIAAFIFQNTPETASEKDEKKSMEIQKSSIKLPEIIFQNQHIIFFNKPSNLSVHGKNSLEEMYSKVFLSRENLKSLSFKPGPLHRIDRMTSGIVAFSNSLEGAHWFSKSIKDHSVKKTYLAIIQGTLKNAERWIDYISAPDDNLTNFHTVKINHNQISDDYKIAVSSIEPVAYGIFEDLPLTFVKIGIETGRQHQIRSQCSYHGYPLFGDTAYNGNKNPFTNNFYLHAFELCISENPLELPSKITASLPHNFKGFLAKTCDVTGFEL